MTQIQVNRSLLRDRLLRCCIVFFLAFVIGTGSTQAGQNNTATLPVVGLGSLSCSAWPADMNKKDLDTNPFAQWVLGAASGKNLFSPPKGASVYLPDDEINIVKYISRYCRENPNRLLSDAVYLFLIR
jgi:hypothetical protein